jgi:hypothetical protein
MVVFLDGSRFRLLYLFLAYHAPPMEEARRTARARRARRPSCRSLTKRGRPNEQSSTIDRWDDATGENLIEQIAAVGDYLVALAAYRAAVQRWPNAKITLRNRARVIEKTWQD